MKRVMILPIMLLFIFTACSKDLSKNDLFIPILIDSKINKNIKIDILKTQHEFYEGLKSDTLGFSSSYLGPTIRLYKNTSTKITFYNKLDESTTVHGHGLHVSGDVDGGPQALITPSNKREINLNIIQEAGLSWYHPHMMGKTAEHVHAGLAGLYIIEDENSLALNLPKTYGVDDIPLVIQDRTFINGVMKKYEAIGETMMTGLREDTLVINGTVNAHITVPQGWIRLRLLNGSNARFYKFYFKDSLPFYKIATEGGFLNAPVKLDSMTMAPGERNEIMINLSTLNSVELLADFLSEDAQDELFFMSWFNETQTVLKLKVDSSVTTDTILPKKLNNIKYFKKEDAIKTREFRLQMGEGGDGGSENMNSMNKMSMFTINGKSMDMKYINELVKHKNTEIWRISGGMMPHPFHIHGVSFQILSINGNAPKIEDRGWKDTVVASGGWTEVIMKFNVKADEKTPFMYHCHILEHEDGGMMGQFTVK